MQSLSVVGLGKLGACTAACLAHRGFPTIGMDVEPRRVVAVNAGRAPVYEPGLQDLLDTVGERLRGTGRYDEVIGSSDVTFVIVPTPSRKGGEFSDTHLRHALTGLSRALRRSEKRYHLFVITSTVSPGTTESRLIPLIADLSGRVLHHGFGVCYSPAFIALGSVIRDFLNPDLVLIGESDQQAGDRLEAIYRQVCQNSPHVARMGIVSAEITKITLNAFATMKISFANTLASICEGVPGANVDAITQALGADRRVSPHGLRGGLPYGGPCFPRDNRAFMAFARRHGVEATLARATDRVNREQTNRLVRLVRTHAAKVEDHTAAVLGLAYKPGTPVIDESPALAVIEELLRLDFDVTIYDPLALDVAREHFGDRVHLATSVKEAMAQASLTVITLPHPEFARIDDAMVAHNPSVIIDCWRVVRPEKFTKDVRYVAVGRHDVD